MPRLPGSAVISYGRAAREPQTESALRRVSLLDMIFESLF
jgi:hypothetical protein